MSSLDVLKRARAILAEKTWRRGRMYTYRDPDKWDTDCSLTADDVTEVCAVGALQIANQPFSMKVSCEALRRVKLAAGIVESALLSEWNDQPERTKDEVVAAFDKAIAEFPEGDHGSETTVHPG